MQRLLLLFVCLMAAVATKAQHKGVIESPKVEYSDSHYDVRRIEFTSEYTIIDLRISHKPNYWVMLSSSAVLKNVDGDEEYKLLKTEGFETDKKIGMPKSGYRDARVFFEPVDAGVTKVDLIISKDAKKNCYGIYLVQPKASHLDAFMGDWITADGSNIWLLGVTEDKLLYKNDIWDYSVLSLKKNSCTLEATKGDKRHTIYLKKEKEGKIALRESKKGDWVVCDSKYTFVSKKDDWSFDGERYKDNYFKSGKVVIRGYISNYSPKSGFENSSCIHYIHELRKDIKRLVEFSEDGTFEFEVDINYPHKILLHELGKAIYVEPNDTILVHIDKKKQLRAEMLWGDEIYNPYYMSNNKNSADLNNFTYYVTEKIFESMPYIGFSLFYDNHRRRMATISKSKTPIEDLIAYRDDFLAKIDDIIATSAEKLEVLQTSEYVKDYLVSHNISNIIEHIFDFEDEYERENSKKPDYVKLPRERYYNFAGKYNDIIFNNPMAVVHSWPLINRYEFSPLAPPKHLVQAEIIREPLKARIDSVFNLAKYSEFAEYKDKIGSNDMGYFYLKEEAVKKFESDTIFAEAINIISEPFKYGLSDKMYYSMVMDIIKPYGVDNNLIYQFALLRSVATTSYAQAVEGGYITKEKAIELLTETVTCALPLITNNYLRTQFLKYYGETINRLSGEYKEKVTISDTAKATLSKILAPYEGNVIYLDFWGLG